MNYIAERFQVQHGNQALTGFYKRISGSCSTLIDVRDQFDGDIDRFLVYLIILLDDVSRLSSKNNANGGVSALSIAEITGIPRETVRRKLAALVDCSMIQRDGLSRYHVCEANSSPDVIGHLSVLFAARDLVPARQGIDGAVTSA